MLDGWLFSIWIRLLQLLYYLMHKALWSECHTGMADLSSSESHWIRACPLQLSSNS